MAAGYNRDGTPDRHRAAWERRIAKAREDGDDELVQELHDLGLSLRYIELPTGREIMNSAIRQGARGVADDRVTKNMIEHARGRATSRLPKTPRSPEVPL